MSFYRREQASIVLFVRLTPRGGSDAIDGVETAADGRAHLKARVRAVPEKGAANAALELLVAKALGLPRKSVTIVSGATARLKTVRIEADPDLLEPRLEALVQRR